MVDLWVCRVAFINRLSVGLLKTENIIKLTQCLFATVQKCFCGNISPYPVRYWQIVSTFILFPLLLLGGVTSTGQRHSCKQNDLFSKRVRSLASSVRHQVKMKLREKNLQNSDFTLWETLHLNYNSKQNFKLLCFKSTINVDQALVLPNVYIFTIKKQL